MKTKDFIVRFVQKKGSIRTSDISRKLLLTRQTAAQHLRELVDAKKLSKVGTTINSRYIRFRAQAKNSQVLSYSTIRSTDGLREDVVFSEINLRMKLRKKLSPPAYQIASYSFTEMLNNAIEHSKAKKVSISVTLHERLFSFDVIDRGIGALESLRRKFSLKDHYEAVEHLLKGKQTTDPVHHSGQGIFFTSKAADRFTLKTAKVSLIIDNGLDDYFLKDLSRTHPGTLVRFELKTKSRRSLKKIFDDYSNADYEFDKTRVTVRLSPKRAMYVSRSEAKRLILGLEKFRRVTFDFKGIDAIGQGFADEIFRVFQTAYPAIKLEPIHMLPSVEFMVKRARADS